MQQNEIEGNLSGRNFVRGVDGSGIIEKFRQNSWSNKMLIGTDILLI